MKKHLLILIFALPIFIGQGVRGQQYVPLVDTNRTWSTYTEMIDFYHTYWTRFADDTTINNKTYKKVIVMDSIFYPQGKLNGYIREDTSKKVFFMNTLLEEGLIYDFNVSQGDSITIHNTGGNSNNFIRFGNYYGQYLSIVDSVYYSTFVDLSNFNSIGLIVHFSDNIDRKIIIIRNIDDSVDLNSRGSEIWVEGIGSIAGVLESSNFLNSEFIWLGATNVLLCSFHGSNLLYFCPKQSHSSCYYSTLETKDIKTNTFSIFPNPITKNDLLKIIADDEIILLKIFNSIGVEINFKTLEKNISSLQSSLTINISDLQSGIYIVKIQTKKSKYYEKFIKVD